MTTPNLRVGLLSACAILIVWSGFIVFARAGLLSGLTPWDVTGLRFAVAGCFTLPLAYMWWPRHLPVRIQILMIVVGPGAVYSTMMFTGLQNASAAYGGVFANGALPLFTMLLALLVMGTRPKPLQILGACIIVLGGVMAAWNGLQAGGKDLVTGIVSFVGASALIATYIYTIGFWNVSPHQALVVVTVPNTLAFVPLWLLVLPSAISEVPLQTVLLQAAFQGLGPGLLAVMIFAAMAFHLGATPTAAVSASVPAAAALLAIPVLGEIPTPLEWAGIATVTVGLGLMFWKR